MNVAGKADTLGNRVRLIIGAFDCPRCFIQFREVINKAKISDAGSNSTAQPVATREIARERGVARVRCPYCDTSFDENLETCLQCGVRNWCLFETTMVLG